MRLKLMLLTTAVVALVASAAFGASGAIPVKDGPNAMQLVDQRGDALSYQVSIGELSALDVATKAGDFTRLAIPGFHSSMVEGSPELPMMNRLIAMPAGARARVEVVSVSSRTFNLADFGIDSPLMPVQPSVSKSADLSALPFVYDRSSYDTDKVSRELVKVVDMGVLRALRRGPPRGLPGGVPAPHQRDRRLRRDRVPRGLRRRRQVLPGLPRRQHQQPVLRPHLRDARRRQDDPRRQPRHRARPGDDGHRHPGDVRGPAGRLRPVEDRARLQRDRRRDRHPRGRLDHDLDPGLPARPVQRRHAREPGAELRDLRGRHRPVPDVHRSRRLDRPPLLLGRRRPVPRDVLRPLLGHEQLAAPGHPGQDDGVRPVHHAGSQLSGRGDHDRRRGRHLRGHPRQRPDQLRHHALLQRGPRPDQQHLAVPGLRRRRRPGGDRPDLQRRRVVHQLHGARQRDQLGRPSMTQANVNSMTNAGKYFMAVGNCCLTSTYDYAECFGETMIRAPNKGAIGYIGASNSTYWDEDYWWGVGYHASSGIDGSALPYESTGLGAYDGVFHDHGEASTQWYVTNDALNFAGNLAVSQSGSSRITYYWNIYNLMGDPSLSTYLGVPGTNPVSHVPTLFTNAVTFALDAAPGSYVGLTQNGVLMAAGTVGAGGSAVLDLDGFLTPGSAHLVVMMQNLEPYIVDVPVIVPAVVSIVPSAIDANVTTPVTVTVYEEDGVTPIVGLDVWAEGLGYTSAAVATNASGVAVISVTYPYGPTVDVVGKRAADPYELFREPLTVNALALTSPDLTVTTGIGMTDLFPLNLPGTLHATTGEPGATLHAVLPDGSEQSTGAASLTLTAAQTGVVTGIIALSGYDLYTETFDVIEAYGQLTGHVSLGGSPAVGAVVRGLDGDMVEVFSATTNASGDYDVGEDVLVDDYTIVVDVFGYLHFEQAMFLNYGPNTFDVAMVAAPSGVLTGVISDAVTSEPLQGIVRVYRSDNSALYTETTSDASGVFTTAALPYFTYTVVVRASHHVPVTISVEVADPVVEKDFLLEPTNGDILVIDDNAKAGFAADKFDEKGQLIAAGYATDDDKAVTNLVNDLEYMGYGVTVQTMSTTVPADWPLYDLLLVSAGSSTTSLNNAAFRTAMINYVTAGGHLLLEGGEVGYTHYGTGAFATTVMHTNDWNHDESGTLEVAAPTHHVMSVPNVIGGGNSITYSGYGDQDAMVPTSDAVMVGTWSTYPTDASVICYDPNPSPTGGQIVFFCFNYAALETGCAANLLENAVNWLLTEEFGGCSVSGRIDLAGSSDDSGVLVEAFPNGGTTYTDAAGNYSLPGLYAGTYTIRASKAAWSIASTSVTLAEGQQLTGVNLTLTSVSELTQCLQPGAADRRLRDGDQRDAPGDGRGRDRDQRRGVRGHHAHLPGRPGGGPAVAGGHDGAPAQPHGQRHGQHLRVVSGHADAVGRPGPVRGPGAGWQLDADGRRPGRRRHRHAERVVPEDRVRRRFDGRGRRAVGAVAGAELPEPVQPEDADRVLGAAGGPGGAADLRPGRPRGADAGQRRAGGVGLHGGVGRSRQCGPAVGQRHVLLPPAQRGPGTDPQDDAPEVGFPGRRCGASRGCPGRGRGRGRLPAFLERDAPRFIGGKVV
ncbi:MAG: carboxypeptidase regulatory-like domain-containing protein [bacterium]|nr:carboxypeptidase regulatory-like domain-containing protein [bacterium]